MTESEHFLGILQLDTQFPRIIGDAGNIDSYPFPARTHIVSQADVPKIVNSQTPPLALQDAFIRAAKDLEKQGAFAIISTCGFLLHLQSVIADEVSIPVCLSALSDYSTLRNRYDAKHIGILTASESSLTPELLIKASIQQDDVSIVGMQDCEAFASVILKAKHDQALNLDQPSIEAACIRKAEAIVNKRPDTAAILLECGNLPPYANAIQQAIQRPVYSIIDSAKRLHGSSY